MEIVIPGFVIFWFGIAGVVTGVVALFLHSVPAQVVIFVVLSAVLVFSAQKIARRWNRQSPSQVGSERLHRAEGLVVKRIIPPEMGTVKVLGEIWRAEAKTAIEPNQRVQVVAVVGNHLVVEPKEQTEGTADERG
jgi:membrane protein implicated in regulation of membrane protease activity